MRHSSLSSWPSVTLTSERRALIVGARSVVGGPLAPSSTLTTALVVAEPEGLDAIALQVPSSDWIELRILRR